MKDSDLLAEKLIDFDAIAQGAVGVTTPTGLVRVRKADEMEHQGIGQLLYGS